MLFQDVAANLDDIVWIYSEDITVEGSVVDLAERKPVRDTRLAVRFAVRDDVRGVEELGVLDVADGAVVVVGIEYNHTKRLLMKPCQGQRRNISPQVRLSNKWRSLFDSVGEVSSFDLGYNTERFRMILYNVYGPYRLVAPGSWTVEIDERSFGQHCQPESDVVPVLRVGATVTIIDEAVLPDGVVVRAVADSRDRYRHHLELLRLPDACGSN